MRTCQSCGRENPPDRDFCDCGEYLRWEPTGFMQAVPAAEAAAPTVDPDAASLSAALQEQLGLKLESARGPVEVVVIDKFEKPTLD